MEDLDAQVEAGRKALQLIEQNIN